MELSSIYETKKLSKKIAKVIKKGDLIFLYGEIGVGKTTFVRFLINHLQIKNGIKKKSEVLSPTFNIVYEYNIKKIKIYHYDLYRLKSYNDIIELGIFENLRNNIKIIEWPELIKPKPKDRIDVIFKYSKKINSRKVKISCLGKCKNYKLNEI
jgi:tRNA threonylcarbamoyladenosine biosynthesis protein TsaE